MFSSDKRRTQNAPPESWDVLADRLDTLSHVVSSTAAALAKKDGELVATRRALEGRMGNIETYVTNALQELRSTEGAPTTRPKAVEPHRDRIDGKFVLLSEEVRTLTAQFETFATRLETTFGRVEANERALKSLTLLTETPGVSSTNQLDPELARQLQDVIDGLDAAAVRIASLEAAQAGSFEDGSRRAAELDDSLVRQLQDVVEGLNAAGERIDVQQERIASLEARRLTEDEGRAEDLDDLDPAFVQQVDSVVQGLRAAAARLELQQDEIVLLKDDLVTTDSGLQLRIEELDSALALQAQDLVARQTASTEQLAAHQARIATLEASAAVPPDDRLHQRIEELDSALALQAQDLVARQTASTEQLEAHQARIATLEASAAVPPPPDDRLHQRVEELDDAVRALAEDHESSERLESAIPAYVEARLSELGGSLVELRDMIDGVDARVSELGATLEGALAEPSVNPAQLESQFAEAGARFTAIVSDLRNLTRVLSASTTRDNDELDARHDALRESLASALERIELLETESPTVSEVSASRIEQLEHELAALRARLRHTASSEELASHLDALRVEVSKAMTRLERTEDLASRTADNTSSSTSRLSSAVDELQTKLDQRVRLEEGLMAKLERAQALWPVALRALEGRIDDLTITNGNHRADEEDLLTALQEGIATAHYVIGDTDHVPDHAENGHNGGVEPPPTRTSAKARRST